MKALSNFPGYITSIKSRLSLRHCLLVFFCLMLSAVTLFWEPLNYLIQRAIVLQYGKLLIIPMGLFFIFTNWKGIQKSQFSPNIKAGSIAVIITCIFAIIGQITLLDSITETAAIGLGYAIILLICGKKIAGFSLMPLFYMWFYLTVLERVVPHIAIYSQYFSAWFAEHALNLTGFAVLRNDLEIRLTTGSIAVAFYCSGINQMRALFAISIPLAHFHHNSIWKRILISASALPLALLMNGLRIYLIGIWNYHEMKSDLHGPHEILLAPVIQPIALAILFLVSWLLIKKQTANAASPKQASNQSQPYRDTAPFSTKSAIIAVCICLVCFGLSATTLWLLKPKKVTHTAVSGKLPLQAGAYTGRDVDSIPQIFQFGKADDIVYRYYDTPQGDEVFVYIATFFTQDVRNRIESACHPSDPLDNHGIPIKVGESTAIKCIKADCRSTWGKIPAYMYYLVNGKAVTSITELRRELALQMITSGSSSATLVLFGWRDMKKSVDSEKVDRTLADFNGAIYPYISETITK